MNLDQAYQTLELNSQATDEEIAKKFKKLAAKYHPDVNKTPEAVEKSKQISEAYSILKERDKYADQGFGSPEDFFQSFFHGHRNSQTQVQVVHPEFPVTLSFTESILGCQRTIEVKRSIPCSSCQGNQVTYSNNHCPTCKGSGAENKVMGNMVIRQTCSSCRGLGRASTPCSPCSGKGTEEQTANLDVKIPAGVKSGLKVRLQGQGNFYPNLGSSDVFLPITVEVDPDLTLRENGRVHSYLTISLLEALKGTKKTVRTVLGEKEVEVPARISHSTELKIPGAGVNGSPQIVEMIVTYPDPKKIQPLIEVLESLEKEKEEIQCLE